MDREPTINVQSKPAFFGAVDPKKLRDYGIYVALLAMVVLFSILSDGIFLKAENLINVFRQSSINLIISIGITFCLLSGNIDLSVGSVAALSGVLTASAVKLLGPIPPFTVFLVAVIISIIIGLIMGYTHGTIVARFRVNSIIATLATLTIVRGIVFIYTQGRPIYYLPSTVDVIGNGFIGFIPIPVIISGTILIFAALILKYTVFGRHVYAVGGIREVARRCGINADRITYLVFIISGSSAALGGALLMCRLNAGQPAVAKGWELIAITSVIIGGTRLQGGEGSMIRTLIGVLIVGILANGLGLLHITSYWQQVITGSVLVAAVALDQLVAARK